MVLLQEDDFNDNCDYINAFRESAHPLSRDLRSTFHSHYLRLRYFDQELADITAVKQEVQ